MEEKMDIRMAKWIVDNFDNKDAFPFEIEVCEKCGTMYKADLGHSCDEVIMVPVHKEGEMVFTRKESCYEVRESRQERTERLQSDQVDETP